MFWATAAGIYVVNCKAFLLFDGNTSQQMAKNPNEFMKGVGLGECLRFSLTVVRGHKQQCVINAHSPRLLYN